MPGISVTAHIEVGESDGARLNSSRLRGALQLCSNVVDSGGFTTQFILYGDTPFPTVSPFGLLELYDANGGPLIIELQ